MKTIKITLIAMIACVSMMSCEKTADMVPTSDPASPQSAEIQRKYCEAYKAGNAQAMTFAVNEAKQKGAAQPTADKCK